MFFDISKFISKYGDRTALTDFKGKKFSYIDVEEIANIMAMNLKNYGIKKGDRVSVISPNQSIVVILFLACIKVGAILVPHNLMLPDSELSKTIVKVKPKTILISENLYEKYKNLKVKKEIKIDILERLQEQEEKRNCAFDNQSIENPSLILFTGGTTGEPKGAILTNRSITFNAFNTILTWKLSEGDRTLLVYPLFHTGGWNVLTIPLLLSGGSVTMVDKFDASRALRIIEGMKITIFSGVPAMLTMMSESRYFERASLSSIRFIKSGGGTTSQQIVDRFKKKGINFYQGYGLTEAGPNIFYSDEEDLHHPFTVGRQSLLVDLKLIDQRGKESNRGELVVGGPIIFSGYYGQKNKTEQVLTNGFVRTGDILYRDDKGFYYFVGRTKFMYKSGGENVYPNEIEKVLEIHPKIIESAVIGVPDEKWGEVGAAYLRVKETLEAENLKKWLSSKLAGYAIPKHFKLVNSIPKTPAGKKDYTKIRRWFDEQRVAD